LIYQEDTIDVNIRLEMVFAAFQDHPKVITTRMIPLHLQKALMQANPNHNVAGKPTVMSLIPEVEYVGIIGSDVALDMAKDLKKQSMFMEGVQIPEKYKKNTIGGIIALPVASFIVTLRQGDSLQGLGGKIGGRPIIATVETSHPTASSTKIRTFLKSKKLVKDLVSQGVLNIINKYNLYSD
jgi:nicotinic acid mononucleotide adenylyltransferase